ncbi:amidase signature enzyme [Stipitochalara longipes BDJ]|nr:amidase signature enzyme [Stipitochalara longipes BDJ]
MTFWGLLERVGIPADEDGFLQVAVASRLQAETNAEQPLAGLRVVVKDNFHLKGLKVSLCNRAYYNTYPPCEKTAVCLQKLIDLGATILGQAKLNSFGVWEEPTEYIDYQAPWNPRGDGYQSPGGSSTGSGAAIAAYEWLDIGIGSDTGGSIFRPGLWNGCFAVRPTFDAVSVDGFVTCIRAIDMPGFLGRDLLKCREFAAKWYGDEQPMQVAKSLSKIIWATEFWDIIEITQKQLAEEFTRDLEDFLGVKQVKVAFEEEWTKSPPEDARGQARDDYMKTVPNDLWYDGYHALDDFRERYEKKYNKKPYVSPVVRGDWEQEVSITKSARDEAIKRLGIHREWFYTQIMTMDSHNSVVIVPIENMSPRYRDDPPTFSRDGHGVMCSYLSPSIGAPEVVVPAGQIPYKSKLTGKTEYLPFAVGIIGLPGMWSDAELSGKRISNLTIQGTDLSLMDMIYEFLRHSGRPTSVQTGSLMFSLPGTQG